MNPEITAGGADGATPEAPAGVIAEAIDPLSGDPEALAFRWTVVLGVG